MRNILTFLTILIGIQINAQTVVKARLTIIADNSIAKEMEAVCDSVPEFDFIAKNFNFPPKIGNNIVYHKAFNANGVPINNIYNLYDSLDRVGTYFYFGSMISGMIPQGYIFEYAENSNTIIRITDDADYSSYNIMYKDGRIDAIKHYNNEGVLLENIDFLYK